MTRFEHEGAHAHRVFRDRPPCDSASSHFQYAPTSYVAFAWYVFAACQDEEGISAA